MDIMTMMMSSMTQGAAMPGSEGGIPGKAVDASGKSPLFATLLGTTMQSRLTDAHVR